MLCWSLQGLSSPLTESSKERLYLQGQVQLVQHDHALAKGSIHIIKHGCLSRQLLSDVL